MAKTDDEALLNDIAGEFHTYLRKGVRFDRVIGSAHADLDIDDVETLLRIHFVLTDAAEDNRDVGVVDFMRRLEERMRRMKTTTSPESYEHRGEIRGQIDWQDTVKTRARAGRLDEPIFVCRQPEEHYNIDENLVLKRLLSVIHETLISIDRNIDSVGESFSSQRWTRSQLRSSFHRESDVLNVSVSPGSARR